MLEQNLPFEDLAGFPAAQRLNFYTKQKID